MDGNKVFPWTKTIYQKLKFLIIVLLLPYFDVFNYFPIKNIYAKFVYMKIMYEICNIIMLLHCSDN